MLVGVIVAVNSGVEVAVTVVVIVAVEGLLTMKVCNWQADSSISRIVSRSDTVRLVCKRL